jgi:Homing endonuclease associated repeat
MKRSLVSQEQIITAIQTCARKLGRPPSRSELTRMTGIAWHPIWTEFRGMCAALRAAGFEPGSKCESPEKDALLLDWAGVVRKVQRLPSRKQYAEHGRYSSGTLHRRFQWSKAPREFYRMAHERGIQAEWKDVLEYLARKVLKRGGAVVNTPRGFARPKPFTAEGAEGRRGEQNHAGVSAISPRHAGVFDTQESAHGTPGSSTFSPLSCHSEAPASSTAASLSTSDCGDANGSGPRTLAPIVDPHDVPSVFIADRLVYGAPLALPSLAHAPVNEHGVIYLFGILAERMGFRVESIHGGYPDCEAKRLVAPGRWQRVLIEFEFLSRNFKDHEHDPDLCDIIVCWRHNWIQCPKNLEVIELSKQIG